MFLEDAPDDTILLIFEYLTNDLIDIMTCIPLVCSRFQRLHKEGNQLWKEVLRVHAPLFNKKQLIGEENLGETPRDDFKGYIKMLTSDKWNFVRKDTSNTIKIRRRVTENEQDLELFRDASLVSTWVENYQIAEEGRIIEMTESVGSGSARKCYSNKGLPYNTGKYYFKYRIKFMNKSDNFLAGIVLKPEDRDYSNCEGIYVEQAEQEKYFEYYIGESSVHFSMYVLEGSTWNGGGSNNWEDITLYRDKYVNDNSTQKELVVGIFVDTDEMALGYTLNNEQFRYDKLIDMKSKLSAQQLKDYEQGRVLFYPAVCMGETNDCLILETNIVKDAHYITKNLLL
jgi:hypothetical protein